MGVHLRDRVRPAQRPVRSAGAQAADRIPRPGPRSRSRGLGVPEFAGRRGGRAHGSRGGAGRGTKAGAEFPLGRDEITIGRSSDSAIIIRDDYTSTHHARIMLWNGRWMIQDLDSTNGTFLNGSRVTVPVPIPLGATVKVGATTFELRR